MLGGRGGGGSNFLPYHTNVCKIPRLRVAISSLASDEWLSNLASIVTLRRSYQRCSRISANDPHQYLKKKKKTQSSCHVRWPRRTDVCWKCSVKFSFFLKSNVLLLSWISFICFVLSYTMPEFNTFLFVLVINNLLTLFYVSLFYLLYCSVFYCCVFHLLNLCCK